MSRAVKLQINQRGAWRDIMRFDIDRLADETEFLVGAAQMVCSSGQMASTTMRIVTDESLPERLKVWSAESGWKDAMVAA